MFYRLSRSEARRLDQPIETFTQQPHVLNAKRGQKNATFRILKRGLGPKADLNDIRNYNVYDAKSLYRYAKEHRQTEPLPAEKAAVPEADYPPW